MALLKEFSLTVVLVMLLAFAFPVWGQPPCTSQLLSNSTIDLNNTNIKVIEECTSGGVTGMTDCSLRCCEKENCSLVVFTESKLHNCLLIYCYNESACDPIPSDISHMLKTIRNNNTDWPNNTTEPSSVAELTTASSTKTTTTTLPETTTSSTTTTTTTTTIPETTTNRTTTTTTTMPETTTSPTTTTTTTTSAATTTSDIATSSNISNITVLSSSLSTWNHSINGTVSDIPSANSTANQQALPVLSTQTLVAILVATLSVGILLLISVLAAVANNAITGWNAQAYTRIENLIKD